MIPLRNARYEDRDVLKQNGAQWDSKARYWVVPDGKDPDGLKEFMDPQTRVAYEMIAPHFKTMMAPAAQKSTSVEKASVKPEVSQSVIEHQEAVQKAVEKLNNTPLDELIARSDYERPSDFKRTHFTKLNLPDDFVVMDTETTGLGREDEVVELSVLDSNANQIYHSFFKPSISVQPEAAATSGIVDKMLVDAPEFRKEWPKIVSVIGGRRIAGHNLQFDKRLVQQTMEKQTGFDWTTSMDTVFADYIDSMLIAKELGVEKGHRGLGKICEAMNIEQHPNHRTSHDCLGVLNVLGGFEHGKYPFAKKERPLPNIEHLQQGQQMSLGDLQRG